VLPLFATIRRSGRRAARQLRRRLIDSPTAAAVARDQQTGSGVHRSVRQECGCATRLLVKLQQMADVSSDRVSALEESGAPTTPS